MHFVHVQHFLVCFWGWCKRSRVGWVGHVPMACRFSFAGAARHFFWSCSIVLVLACLHILAGVRAQREIFIHSRWLFFFFPFERRCVNLKPQLLLARSLTPPTAYIPTCVSSVRTLSCVGRNPNLCVVLIDRNKCNLGCGGFSHARTSLCWPSTASIYSCVRQTFRLVWRRHVRGRRSGVLGFRGFGMGVDV